jgi:hypothetical protein
MKERRSKGIDSRLRARSLAAGAVLPAVLLFATVLPSFGGPGLPRRTWGLALGGLFPAGAFNDRVPQNGLGMGFFYGWRVGDAPVFAGLELSLHAYGRVSRPTSLVDYPGLMVDVETLNNIMQGLGVVRIQPRTGAVVTYVEVLAGISYLFTETTISGGYDYDDDLYSETNFDDVTVTAGAGGGLSIRPGRAARRAGGDVPRLQCPLYAGRPGRVPETGLHRARG